MPSTGAASSWQERYGKNDCVLIRGGMGSAAADAGGSSHQTGIAGGGQRIQRGSIEAKPERSRNYGLHPPSSQPELEQGRPGRVCLPRRSLALFSGEDSAPGDVPQPVPKLQAPSASERPPGVPGESRVSPASSVLPPRVSSRRECPLPKEKRRCVMLSMYYREFLRAGPCALPSPEVRRRMHPRPYLFQPALKPHT